MEAAAYEDTVDLLKRKIMAWARGQTEQEVEVTDAVDRQQFSPLRLPAVSRRLEPRVDTRRSTRVEPIHRLGFAQHWSPAAEVALDSPRDTVIDLRLSPQLTQPLTTNDRSEGAIDLDVIGLQVSGHPRGYLHAHYVRIHSGDNTGVREMGGR